MQRLLRTGALSTAVLAAAAILAWFVGWPTDRSAPLLPISSGAAFGLGAGALLALHAERTRLARGLAVVVLGAGLTVTLAYALDFDWGRVAWTPSFLDARLPLQVAPNTGVVLVLFGLAVLALRRRPVLSALAAMLAIVLGSVALMGHILELPELARWGGTRPMGWASALASILLGGATLGAVLPALRIADPVGYWMSTVAAVIIPGAFVFLLWVGLVSHQDQAITKATADAATTILSSIQRDVHGLRSALEVVATGEPTSPNLLERPVAVLTHVSSGFLRMERIGADDAVRLSVAAGGPVDEALPVDDAQRAAFRTCRETQQTLVGPFFTLPDGSRAFRVITPLWSGRRDELVTAVVRVDDFLQSELAHDAPEFGLRLHSSGAVVFTRDFDADTEAAHFTDFLRPLSVTPWTLAIQPLPVLVDRMHGGVAELLLGTGAIVVLLLSITLRTAGRSQRYAQGLLEEIGRRREAELHAQTLARELDQRVRDRTAALQEANTALRTENAVRLDAQQRLARSNQDLQRFAAFVSHELKQPLATVSLFADLLATAPPAMLQTKGPDYVAKMRRAIARMARLIDAELALSRGTQSDLQRVRMPLGTLVGELVADLGPAIAAAEGRVTVGALPEAFVEPDQMRQVFRNLIENALKYRHPGQAPEIRIDGGAVPPDDGRPARCEITVRDNGRGFKPEFAEHMFDVFRRADGEDEVDGSGIGLALCRRIIERHGGAITAVGAEDRGATFTIVLPDPDLAGGETTLGAPA